LLSLAILAIVLWTGWLPLIATPLSLGLLCAPAVLLALTTGAALSRGHQTMADTSHFELCTAEINLRALRCVIRPGKTQFKVTPKQGVDLGGWEAIRQLRIVTTLTLLLALGLIARVLDDLGLGVIPRVHGMTMWLVPLLATCELRRLLRTLATLFRRLQPRADYRVPLRASVVLSTAGARNASIIGRAVDITPAGIGVVLPRPLEPQTGVRMIVPLPTLAGGHSHVGLELEVLWCRPVGSSWRAGARITSCLPDAHRRLLEYCYLVAPRRRLRGVELRPPRIAAGERPAQRLTAAEIRHQIAAPSPTAQLRVGSLTRSAEPARGPP
jgi:hypothetical protein